MNRRIEKKLSKKLTVILASFQSIAGWYLDRHPESAAKLTPSYAGEFDSYLGDANDSVTVYQYVKAHLIHALKVAEREDNFAPITQKRMTGKLVIELARYAALHAREEQRKHFVDVFKDIDSTVKDALSMLDDWNSRMLASIGETA